MFGDLNGSGLGDSDAAAIAYAKLKAVYPTKAETLVEGTPESFADDPAVREILGSIKVLNKDSVSGLYDGLQQYVDSKEVTGVNVPMEYWPLVKAVRIYTKAAALSTGAVIVDLVRNSLR